MLCVCGVWPQFLWRTFEGFVCGSGTPKNVLIGLCPGDRWLWKWEPVLWFQLPLTIWAASRPYFCLFEYLTSVLVTGYVGGLNQRCEKPKYASRNFCSRELRPEIAILNPQHRLHIPEINILAFRDKNACFYSRILPKQANSTPCEPPRKFLSY